MCNPNLQDISALTPNFVRHLTYVVLGFCFLSYIQFDFLIYNNFLHRLFLSCGKFFEHVVFLIISHRILVLLHSTRYFFPVLHSPTNVVGKLVAKHIVCYFLVHFLKPQSKDTSYVWFRSFTYWGFSIPVSCSYINCWIIAFVSVRCVVSCFVCVCNYFSTSICWSSRICVRSQSAAVCHSRRSPYLWH